MKAIKIPKHKIIPPIKKEVKSGSFTNSTYFSWQISKLQLDGEWGWKNVDSNIFIKEILPAFQAWEKMKIGDLLGKQNHILIPSSISERGKVLLRKIVHREFLCENVISLHIDGTKRIIGLRNDNIVSVLFWDPEHTFSPSQLSHT